MTLVAGQTLSFYEILGPLGVGGMGEVYRARDTRLDREVAIKVLPEEFADDEERLLRFEREAKTLASLNHPNVAGIHGVDQEGDVWFLALELVPGEDLAERLERGPLPVDEAIDVCRQIAEGLEAAHEAGVIHRDLKPANVRVTPEGVVKILDFGLAKPIRPHTKAKGTSSAEADSFLATEEGLVLGTPTYMSPEQARGKPVDRRTDIWAFGCVLYECLTGERAFRGDSLVDLLASITRGELDLSCLPEEVPPAVRQLVARCIEGDTRERLRDVGEARVLLGRIQRGVVETVTNAVNSEVRKASSHREFALTTELVRSLENPVPRMIGDAMTYLDNDRGSDTVVVFLPGLGLDERIFTEALSELPHRAVAVSPYGFGPSARLRPPLSIEDHSLILSAFLAHLEERIRPVTKILVGFSTGADQLLHFLASDASAVHSIDGLLLLSPNSHLGSTFLSRVYANLSDDPEQVLSGLKTLGAEVGSLGHWLRLHAYIVQALDKFGTDLQALKYYSRQVVEVMEGEEAVFFRLFRTATQRVPHVRCVFAEDEAPDADRILRRHLEEDLLAPHYREDMISVASVGHMLLADHAVLRPYLDELSALVRGERAS